MYTRDPGGTRFGGVGGGLLGPVPRDIAVLLGVVFLTFSLRFFASTQVLPELLRLTPAVWRLGFLWQLVSYPYIGTGAPDFWFLLGLLILYMFGRDVFWQLGRRRFWRLLTGITIAAAAVAVLTDMIMSAVGGGAPAAFAILQGQYVLMTVLVAAFATLNQNATILLFFVLPIQARWFLPLEVVFGFLGFLNTRDLPGFVGICTAVGATYVVLSPGRARDVLRRIWLRAQQRWLRLRLEWLRRRRGIRLVKDREREGRGPWLH